MSEIDFGAINVPAIKETENNLPENTLPVLSFRGDKTIFNKKAVAFPGYSEKSIAEKLSGAKEFLASKPDLNDKKVYQQLVSYQSEVVGCRTGLEKVRKGITAIYRSVTEYTNKKAKEMLVEQGKLEAEIKELRNKHDAEVERIQQEEAENERVRVQAIEDRIEEIRNLPASMIGCSSAEIAANVQTLSSAKEDFEEFSETGLGAKRKSLNLLKELHKTKEAEEQQEKEAAEAEKERAKKEAADRVELDRKLKALEIQQEAAVIMASVSDFVSETPERLEEYAVHLSEKYKDYGDERATTADTVAGILRSMIPAAEQREAVAKQAAEQEEERKRLTEEKEAEDKRKAQAEADKKAEEAKAKQHAVDLELYKEACELAEKHLTRIEDTGGLSVWSTVWGGVSHLIQIELGKPDLLPKVELFIKQQKAAFEAHEKARGEAEARKAEDMGQTIADIMDIVASLLQAEVNTSSDIAEVLADAISNGEISHVTWSNER